jgi:hypothetical protein
VAGGDTLTVQTERVRVKERVRIRRRRRKGRWIAGAAALVVFVVGMLALGYLPARSARSHVLAAREAIEDGRAELLRGRVDQAVRQFDLARSRFVEASSAARNPLLHIAGWVPLVGRTPDIIKALADGGELAALASSQMAQAVGRLPGGLSSLTPRGGRIPVEQLEELAPAVERASRLVHGAHLDLQDTAGGSVPGQVADARYQGLAQLSSLDKTVSTAANMLDRLPAFFGATRPMRYFFGAQTPAELRGTGGLIGSYSTLTIHRGRLRFSRFRPTADLPSLRPTSIDSPSRDFARHYNQFGGAAFWPNINMTPDFPTAARAMLNLYKKGTGASLDGVIVADPFALKSMLEVTGPVAVPGYNVTVDAGNVVAFTANRAYEAFTGKATRQLVLGEVAKRVLAKFMQLGGSPRRSIGALLDTIASGHLLVYSTDPKLEEALLASGSAGALAGGGGDFLSVIQNNGAGNKVDFYQDRSVNYSVVLAPEGNALGTATVVLTNNAPNRGASPYIIGPYRNVAPAGENVTFVSAYCNSSCEIRDFKRNGQNQLIVAGRELGYRFYQDYFRIPSKEQATLQFDLANTRAWEGNHAGGVYRLTFRNQPTIRPTTLRVEVRAPEGMHAYFTNVPMKVSGGTAVWEGTPGARLDLEVRFQPPFFRRVWNSITDFLSKPVF